MRGRVTFSSSFGAEALIMNCVRPGRFNAPVSPVTSELPASSYLVLTVRFKVQHRHQPFNLTRLFTRVHHLNWQQRNYSSPTKKRRQTAGGFARVGEPSALPVRHDGEVAALKYWKCCTLTAPASARWCRMTICQRGYCHTGLLSTYCSNITITRWGVIWVADQLLWGLEELLFKRNIYISSILYFKDK